MNYTLNLPEPYTQVPLPGLTAWLKALRSGDFLQGKGWLCDGTRYCCLGVLSEIQGRLTNNFEDGDGGLAGRLSADNPLYDILSSVGRLPDGALISLGGSDFYYLAALNDNGLTFPEIADILEAVYVEGEV